MAASTSMLLNQLPKKRVHYNPVSAECRDCLSDHQTELSYHLEVNADVLLTVILLSVRPRGLWGLCAGQWELVDTPYITAVPKEVLIKWQLPDKDESKKLWGSGEIPLEVYLVITVLKLLADRSVVSGGQLRYCIMNLFIGQFCIKANWSPLTEKERKQTLLNGQFSKWSVNMIGCCFHYFLFCNWAGGTVILNGRKGVITSPGFPNPYPPHLKSSWKISVPSGQLVKLEITDMAIPGEIGKCKQDKLIISDDYGTLGEPELHLLLFYIDYIFCNFYALPYFHNKCDILPVRVPLNNCFRKSWLCLSLWSLNSSHCELKVINLFVHFEFGWQAPRRTQQPCKTANS